MATADPIETLVKTVAKGGGLLIRLVFFAVAIVGNIIDFDEHNSFTLNGIEYETPAKNAPSEEFEFLTKCKKSILI